MTDVQDMGGESFAEVEKFLTSVTNAAAEDPAAVSAAIVGSILQAKTADEVLAKKETTSAESILGVTIALTNVRWMKSGLDDGPGFYALLEAADMNGERLTISCGSRNVMAQAYRLAELGALPCYCAIVQSDRKTASGYYVQSLEGRTAS